MKMMKKVMNGKLRKAEIRKCKEMLKENLSSNEKYVIKTYLKSLEK
jgi:hypothetical protein